MRCRLPSRVARAMRLLQLLAQSIAPEVELASEDVGGAKVVMVPVAQQLAHGHLKRNFLSFASRRLLSGAVSVNRSLRTAVRAQIQ